MLRTPQMERVKQLVSIDVPVLSLVSTGNSLELEKTLMLQRGQKCILAIPPVLDSPKQDPAVSDGGLNNFTVSAVKMAGFAVQVGDSSNFNLRFNADLKERQTSVGKSSNLWQELRFGFQLRILYPLISVNRHRIMYGNGLFFAAPVDPHLPWHEPRQPSRRKLVDI